MPELAADFLTAFGESYRELRKLYSRTEWRDVWGLGLNQFWNWFMLWTTNRPPTCRGTESVMAQTARRLGLEYWEREPLKLDGAYYSEDASLDFDLPFPLRVAIEHENFDINFCHEIRKLMLVRCALKVGITYTWDDRGPTRCSHSARREAIRRTVCTEYERINSAIGEDPQTEYVFLVGSEESFREWTWYFLMFSASAGPENNGFVPA